MSGKPWDGLAPLTYMELPTGNDGFAGSTRIAGAWHDSEGRKIAVVGSGLGRVFAAAPELYEALMGLCESITDAYRTGSIPAERLLRAKAALEKAGIAEAPDAD